jgi:hypothetical protein
MRVRDWRQARRVRGSLPISIGQDLVLSTMALLVLELSLGSVSKFVLCGKLEKYVHVNLGALI